MGIISTVTARLRSLTHRAAPAGPDTPAADPGMVGDLDLGDRLARLARLTERLAVLAPADTVPWQRHALMLRALSGAYYRRAGLHLPHPDPARAFPAVAELLQQLQVTGGRTRQAALLGQIHAALHAADGRDPALDAVRVAAAELAAPPLGAQRPPARPAQDTYRPARPESTAGAGHSPTPAAAAGARPSGARLASQFPRWGSATTARPVVAPVLRSPAARADGLRPAGRSR
ncbi:hypothetical protein [Actinoplanes sp. L3-i22]|uniref:hypothetical protein n=1 Tax=Actinoplanes sp. L3-i22 TaxID=2836373 RepID=UPI001C779429|nr:hypothetical protein [Actinoplanes sp. L3-i22]BCY10979.1 hypothetical protein L3i22_060670 [Actinoplanes sp. L3-i22]